jgi:hypothetical protein
MAKCEAKGLRHGPNHASRRRRMCEIDFDKYLQLTASPHLEERCRQEGTDETLAPMSLEREESKHVSCRDVRDALNIHCGQSEFEDSPAPFANSVSQTLGMREGGCMDLVLHWLHSSMRTTSCSATPTWKDRSKLSTIIVGSTGINDMRP